MSKKVLIRKNSGGGVQGFYDISGDRPSFGQLRRRTRDPTASAWQKIGAGLGMLGKVGAAGVTGLQTAYGLQGGNVGAALQIPQTYAALDPTAGQSNAVTPHEQQQELIRQRDAKQRQEQLAAMTTLNIPVTNVHQMGATGQSPLQSTAMRPNTQPTPPPAGIPPAPPVPAAQPAAPVAPAQPPVPAQTPQAAPAAPAPAVDPTLSQTLGGFGLKNGQQTGTPLPPMQFQTPTGTGFEQTKLPQGQSPAPAAPTTANPLQPASLTHYQGTINPATGQPYPVLRSFVEQVLNEFGDMLHKADPHVAGLLAFRVYMDKVMR
tara:strand:- start:19253 stop:20209 length:957 start_codon:yes stop_codon:yes gene_type:complete